ncbi:molecular chaperone GrpE [Carnobacterium iners]|uniref:Protein GrpE n=1 Tax=Carnobacterium iners TaxID=1073423 RepID=A0A1X7NID0_9LACT|nr:nucleotide exchange factor GrpE [Carnobacterium iners]SEK80173.1 molecular chaperone GrpE [Carnobacterium iners]SMH36859.1 molecular chaperone GrpE [Carnobacterium iners]
MTENQEEENSKKISEDSPETVEEIQSQENGVIEEVDELEEIDELEKMKSDLNEKEDQYLRLQAELANMRKRNQKEKEDTAKYRSQSLATELLPVIDNLERALAIEVTDNQGESLKKGLEMVMESFKVALKNEGIEVIDPLNQLFDPNYHQAIQTTSLEEGQEADTVVNVFQKGYSLKDRVLRPAMVIVAQ